MTLAKIRRANPKPLAYYTQNAQDLLGSIFDQERLNCDDAIMLARIAANCASLAWWSRLQEHDDICAFGDGAVDQLTGTGFEFSEISEDDLDEIWSQEMRSDDWIGFSQWCLTVANLRRTEEVKG